MLTEAIVLSKVEAMKWHRKRPYASGLEQNRDKTRLSREIIVTVMSSQ